MFDVAAKPLIRFYFLIAVAAMMFFFYSCGVKNYPPNTPFVYKTNIHLDGKFNKDEKNELLSQLDNQLHDSINPRRKRVLFFFKKLNKPPVFDTINIGRSKVFMNALLNSVGFYRDSIYEKYDTTIDGDKHKVTIDFFVNPGKLITLDSVWHNLLDSVAYSPAIDTLEQLTKATWHETVLKKGSPFSKPLISGELDRLTNVYRNNGYLRFSKEQLLAVWDTVGLNLLSPTLDFEEQLRLLEALRQRRENPVADIEIRLKPNPDTSRLKKYYVGKVTVYPDYNLDTAFYNPTRKTIEHNGATYDFISYGNKFRPSKIVRFIYLRNSDLYRQSNYLKTQNRFNTLGSWRLVTINQFPRYGQDTVDFELRLVPALKYNPSINLDISRNQSNLLAEGGFIGFGATASLVNRNFLKSANQSTTNNRYGIELTKTDIQTQQFTLGYTVKFPRYVGILKPPSEEWLENANSFFSLNAGITDRIDYFRVTSFNTSWRNEFTWKKILLGLTLPNIEFNTLKPRPLLDTLIKYNSSYRYIFNDGIIVSTLVNATLAFGKKKDAQNIVRLSAEESGLLAGIFIKPPDNRLYRFIKLDGEYTHTRKLTANTSLALRALAGIGFSLPFSLDNGKPDSSNLFMPFFRQYYGGGPNSMRAWTIRRLGPGSSLVSFDRTKAPDRFGDIRLEANAEYRFLIAKLATYPFEGAAFVDMGNVWFKRYNADFPDGEFDINRLWKDIAIGAGYGLRIDFGFLRVRADFAYKAKDPSPDINEKEAQNKLFYKWHPISNKDGKRGPQFQLGINYPF